MDLPPIGVSSAFAPCSECFEVIERDALIIAGKPAVRPGTRLECSACRNVLMARTVEKTAQGWSHFNLGAGSGAHALAGVMFSTRNWPGDKPASWLAENKVEGFVEKSAVRGFRRFGPEGRDAEVDVYVPMGYGVYGTCVVEQSVSK